MGTWDNLIKDYQTLIAGILAIIAAIIAFIGAIKAARTQANAAIAAANAQIIHFKEEEEALLQRRRVAFTFALRLAAFLIKQQAEDLLSLVNDKEFSLNPIRSIIDQQKLSVPEVLRSRWEDMALLEERFQIMKEYLVIDTEKVNARLDDWIEYHELRKTMKQEEMGVPEPAVNKTLNDLKESAQQLIEELQEWIEKRESNSS